MNVLVSDTKVEKNCSFQEYVRVTEAVKEEKVEILSVVLG